MKNYDASAITVLKGLEPVRKRPGMYIGSTNVEGLHHLVWEIVDNAIDEVLAGFATKIYVTLKQDGSVIVEDNGRGIPVDVHKSGKSALEVVFTTLHAGGKFEEAGAYKVSGGLHGVGASIVTALSTKVIANVFRDKKHYQASFEAGGTIINPVKEIGPTSKRGTQIQFYPDPLIFKQLEFKMSLISERLREAAFLLNNLEIRIDDEINNKSEVFQYEKGLVEFIDFAAAGKTRNTKTYDFTGEANDIIVNFAFQYVNSYSEILLSFVNNVKTIDGGSHVIGFRSAWTKVLNDYARKKGLLKGKDENLDGNDFREGLIVILSIRIPEKLLEFVGQTKDKLGTPIARNAVETVIISKMEYWLEEHRNQAQTIVQNALNAASARIASRKARDETRKLKGLKQKRRLLSGKLTPPQKRDPKRNELFLVEGDSAGGSAKMGRDRRFQAILPLRGKVINAEKSMLIDMIKNEEILSIISAIGADFAEDFVLRECQYDKIIIMTDADTDGAHIQTLLITFFFRYMRELVRAKKIFIALPPLFKVSKASDPSVFEYAWDETELKAISRKFKKISIQRYKGLGEMNANQLWETTMDPATRTLIRINIMDEAIAERRVSVLMGSNAEKRREWIEENVEFTLLDEKNEIIEEKIHSTEGGEV